MVRPPRLTFTRAALEAARNRRVPDLVGDDVRLVFVGVNPGLWTAAVGAHFAHPGNRFYKALYAAGITESPLDVRAGFSDATRGVLQGRGIALTNLVNRATARADELDRQELRRGARQLASKLARWRPRVVAFVGLGAYRSAYDRVAAHVGPQAEHRLAGAEVWALPNPSGLNAHYPVAALARSYRSAARAAGIELGPLRV